MSALIKRAYSRDAYEAPIMYANYDTENYYHAKMYNSGPGGMYFETERAIQPGSEICIKMINYPSDISGPESFKAYRARVEWCKEARKKGISCYGIGVKYLAKSHSVYGGNVHGLSCSCDLCGETVPCEEIFENEDLVCLCINCFNYLKNLPSDKTKESIKKFLIGNVI
jgi:hypothetical protein